MMLYISELSKKSSVSILETTPSSHQTSATAGPILPECSEAVTFEAREPSSDRVYVYTETVAATTGQECAQLCYQRRCTHAYYVPAKSNGTKSSCSLGYHDESCNADATRQSVYQGTRILSKAIEFHCVRCGKLVVDTTNRQRC